jgi:hypothetical protein
VVKYSILIYQLYLLIWFAQLRSDKWDFVLSDNVSITFFNERLSDLVAGVQAQFSLALPYVADRCAVPSSFPLPDGVE